MSYPTILPAEAPETSGTTQRAFDTIVSSVFLRTLGALALITVVARVGANITGVGDLA